MESSSSKVRKKADCIMRWKTRLIEVVDYDTHEEVHNEVRPDQHEDHEEPHPIRVDVTDWLHVLVRGVYRSPHDYRPTLGSGDLEERQQGLRYVVELLLDCLVPLQPEAIADLWMFWL